MVSSDDGTSSPGAVGTTFMSGVGTYNATIKTFSATWDGGNFSNTYFEARLNATEQCIEYFHARQTYASWTTQTSVHEIRGHNILHSHSEGNSKYFIVDGSDART